MLIIPKHALSLGDDMAVAIKAAAGAGGIIQLGWGKSQLIDEKGIGDLVSGVDRDADGAIRMVLEKYLPGDAIISEELAPSASVIDGRQWIADPLDGTSAFLFRAWPNMPSVLIALREGSVTLLAVILFPLTGEWFYAVRNKGAYKNGVRVTTAERANALLQHSWVDMNQNGDASLESQAFSCLRTRLRSSAGARLVTTMPPHSGIAARIACGVPDISAVIHDNNPGKVKQAVWDVVAPMLFMEEAGGVFLNLRGERYDPFHPEPFIAAVSAAFALQVLALLKLRKRRRKS